MDSLKGSQDPQGFPGHTLRTADQSNEIQEKANGDVIRDTSGRTGPWVTASFLGVRGTRDDIEHGLGTCPAWTLILVLPLTSCVSMDPPRASVSHL